MRVLILLILFLPVLASCQRHQDELPNQLNLPLTIREGYGPFGPSFGKLSPESPDYPKGTAKGSAGLPLRGMPRDWVGLVKSRIDLDFRQFLYQNYQAGKVDSAWYTGFKTYWHWSEDTRPLATHAIKCYVYAIRGYDPESGKWLVMVDTNNNLDFSDETAQEPGLLQPGTIPDAVNQPLTIWYEVYQQGQIRKAQALMTLRRMGDDFFYNFPQHAVATFRDQEIPVLGNLTSLDFALAEFTLPADLLRSGKADPQKMVAIGQTVQLEGIPYRSKGVNLYHNVLQLERVNPTNRAYTLQLGQPFRPFRATEFSTGKTVSLADFKGKYVYIDFWATWCKGCVEDMHELKKLYQELDKKRFAFLGIVANDSPERVRNFLRKEVLDWPQIVSDSTDKIAESYGIRGLPVTVLLDPQGRIIARDLRGKPLAQRLKAL